MIFLASLLLSSLALDECVQCAPGCQPYRTHTAIRRQHVPGPWDEGLQHVVFSGTAVQSKEEEGAGDRGEKGYTRQETAFCCKEEGIEDSSGKSNVGF